MARKHKGILRAHSKSGTDIPGHGMGSQGSGEKHFSSRQMSTTKGRGKRKGTYRSGRG
jgi:hypothetical protein